MVQPILIVEDDAEIAELIEINLRSSNYHTYNSSSGTDGLQKALSGGYSMVVLDLMLPGMDGLEVCREIRHRTKSLPILMLTSKSEEVDKVLGLEMGADDYLTKPFSVRELVARVKAILRRVQSMRDESETAVLSPAMVFGHLRIEPEKRKVFVGDQPVELTAREFDLLILFASNPGRAYTRAQLLDSVWGYQYSGYDHTVNTHINRLRSKIEDDPARPAYINTVWGIGYRFAEPEDLPT